MPGFWRDIIYYYKITISFHVLLVITEFPSKRYKITAEFHYVKRDVLAQLLLPRLFISAHFAWNFSA